MVITEAVSKESVVGTQDRTTAPVKNETNSNNYNYAKSLMVNNDQLLLPAKNIIHRIKIIGVGGCGGNALNNYLYNSYIDNNETELVTIACNTDFQDIYKSHANIKFLLNENTTENFGIGAGGNPIIGEKITKACEKNLIKILDNTDIVIIMAGMGGGTGTGATPIISEIAKDMGILTIVICTIPFAFEGKVRRENAFKGLEKIKNKTDTLFILENDKLKSILPGFINIKQAFAFCDKTLTDIAKIIVNTILNNGYINLDFADIKNILQSTNEISKSGYVEHFLFNNIFADNKDEKTTKEDVMQEINATIQKSLFIPSPTETKYSNIILNIQANTDNLPLFAFDLISNCINENLATPDANIIVGLTETTENTDKIKVSLFATTNCSS